ncbi:MAG: GIN domain-containing protein [Psychroflexus salarius]
MTNKPTIVPLILLILFLTSATSLKAQSKIVGNREVEEQQQIFDEPIKTLIVGSNLEIELIKSARASATLEADSNLHSAVDINLSNGVLNCSVNKIVKRSKSFKILVRYTEALKTIVLNNEAALKSKKGISTKQLNLTLNDDASVDTEITCNEFTLNNNNNEGFKIATNCELKIESQKTILNLNKKSNNKIELNTDNLTLAIKDKADLSLVGFAKKANVTATNSSKIKAEEFKIMNLDLYTSEDAEVTTFVENLVNISAIGNSVIELYGEARIRIDALKNEASLLKQD